MSLALLLTIGTIATDPRVQIDDAMLLEQNQEWSPNRRYVQLQGLQTPSDTAPTRLAAVQP